LFLFDDDCRELRRRIHSALHQTLDREIWSADASGRQKFLEWLFRLADTANNNIITRGELHAMLEAVRRDGVDVSRLHFRDVKQEGGKSRSRSPDANEETVLGTPPGEGIDAAPRSDSELKDTVDMILLEYGGPSQDHLTKAQFMVLGDLVLREYESRSKEALFQVVVGTEDSRMGPFALGQKLGEGSFGAVRLGISMRTGAQVAVKIIPRGNCADMSRVDLEIQAMMKLTHVNVVRLYDVIDDPRDSHVYLVMELCGGGSLADFFADRPLRPAVARYYFQQLLHGVQYCHSMGVCHRDLRLENLLLSNDGILKITDFGQCRLFKKGWDLFATTLTGSLYHLSPEQIAGRSFSGRRIDTWSCGIVLYAMLQGKLPFWSDNVNNLFAMITKGEYSFSLPIDGQLSQQEHDREESLARDLIGMMLNKDPEQRASVDQLLQHQWLQGTIEVPDLLRFAYVFHCGSASERDALLQRCFFAVFDEFHVHKHEQNPGEWHCNCPRESLRFSIRATDPQDGKVTVELVVRDGPSQQFRKMVRKIEKRCGKSGICLEGGAESRTSMSSEESVADSPPPKLSPNMSPAVSPIRSAVSF
jgi:serine/threonine protein kinase